MAKPTLPIAHAAYLHVPFCRHRCGYCNFTVVAGRDELAERYLAAVERELQALETPRPVDTLFVGGGTPTHLARGHLARLLSLAHQWFPLTADGEWSVEANPVDVDAKKLGALASAGVTRLSLGVQSFRDAKLRLLERDHSGEQAREAVAAARSAVATVAVDLIFATPGETLDDWSRDLDAAIALEPDHISTYGLTIEKGTSYWTRRRTGDLAEVDEETQRAMYESAIERLTAAGYEHYEVSNFARPGHRCRHNEAYWRGDEFFAAGPGASRYLAGRRETNHRSTTTYIARVLAGHSPVAEVDELSPRERACERLVFALRRIDGVRRGWFATATGFMVDELARTAIERYVQLGLVDDDGETIRLTREGLLVSDALWPQLLAP
ncbi:MAG: coproporphyrinogen III oxidase [Planctomycetota bacterium]|nr:MAG: coproporphyrinogen III oxidase [Planctomycetota bacterium]